MVGTMLSYLRASLLVMAVPSAAAFRPPEEILGNCAAMCVYEKGSGYPCPYTPTYPVRFFSDGDFDWRAPYRDGSYVEVGKGKILSTVHETVQADGSWEAQWFGGNQLLAPALLNHVTHCACYYAKGTGMGTYWYLSNYGVAAVPNSTHLTVESVCMPYLANMKHCPASNASAFATFPPPWIEAYKGCDRDTGDAASLSVIFV